MKNINFKTVKIEGFGSFITPSAFPLERGGGVNIIRGLNGSGKTTIFNALFWTLYGENLKGVTQTKLPTKKAYRTKDWRGTRVAISLDVDNHTYLIIRHISFKGTTKGLEGGSTLMIFQDGELVGEKLHKGDQKEFIIDLLGMDSRVFLNSILFGQRMKKFIEAKPEEKRKIFESIFDMDFVEDAKEKAKDYSNELKEELNILWNKIDKNNILKSSLDTQLINGNKVLKEFKIKKDERVKSVEVKITDQNKKIKTSESQINLYKEEQKEYEENIKAISIEQFEADKAELSKLEDLQSDLEKKKKSAKQEINTATEKIKEIKLSIENVKTVCPTCTQSLPIKSVDNVKKSLKSELKLKETNLKLQETGLEVFEKDLDKFERIPILKTSIKEFEIIKEDLKGLEEDLIAIKSDLTVEESKLELLKGGLLTLQSDLKSEKASKPPKIDTKDLELRISTIEKDNKVWNKDHTNKTLEKEKTDWWIKKGFGSSGMRSYIFNAMMTKLNHAIKKYAARLGFLIHFSIDMEKASKPFLTKCYTVDEIPMDYGEFSGGEKARIDVASAFAIHDLVSSNSSINILIMDEIFEGLDEEGIGDAFDLIGLKSQGRNLYIITHSKTIDSLNCKHIDLVKIDNNSNIE